MASLRLTQQLRHQMILTPQLRQRIEMLQMTTLELAELIQNELVENPILEEVMTGDEIQEIADKILDQNTDGQNELTENGGDDLSLKDINDAEDFKAETPDKNGTEETADFDNDSDDAPEENHDSFEEMDFGSEFQDYLDPGYKTQEFEHKEDQPSFEQFLSYSPNLTDHLEWQLNMCSMDDATEEAAFCIIGNLNSDGRLTANNEEIAEMCGASLEKIEKARQIVMQLEPVGCAVRDVKECLIAQLIANDEADSLAVELVAKHLENIQPHRLQHLAKETGRSLEELDEEINKIRILDPYPGRRYSTEEPIYVAPEVYIEKIEGEYVIYFADDGSPRLRISSSYRSLVDKDETSKETKDFIKEKVRSAIDLLRNIEHRKQTIYKVVDCIVRKQEEFLNYGVQHIKPMMLKDVAEDIGMHLSTISRVVNRKYAHTPQGVIELRRFFSEGMLNEDGEEVSTRILKLKIKKMIEEEDTKKPLTDDKIAKALGRGGVKLSRRTVAKYRDQMQIPGSRERKTVI